MKNKAGKATAFYCLITSIIIWFQSSPVKIIKLLTNEPQVVEKLYLETFPSSSYKFPGKNYLPRREAINK